MSWFSYVFPETGSWLIRHEVLTFGLILSFFLTGVMLESRAVVQAMTSIRAVLAAAVSSLVLFPVLAWVLTRPFGSYELIVGCCIIAAGPVTVSSGTILTAYARGNVPLSVFICILTHVFAVFSIPVILDLLLGSGYGIDLPIFSVLIGLVLKVIVPLVVGQIMKPLIGRISDRGTTFISVFQMSMILLMVSVAVSSSAERLESMGGFLLIIVLLIVILHFSMVFLNYFIARGIQLDRDSLVAFTIHTPQKTLAVSYLVWAGYYAADFPGAFVPAIVCHLVQMVSGTFIAQYFRKNIA